MSRYFTIAKSIETGIGVSFIKTHYHESARRIINRCMSKGWWFVAHHVEGIWYIALQASVDLDNNLRAKLTNLRFELD